MRKRIRLKSNFSLGISDSEDFYVPSDMTTIGELLQYISEEINLPLISTDLVDLQRDIEVIMNGKDIWFCTEGLKTLLTDGDSVEVYLVPLGGG